MTNNNDKRSRFSDDELNKHIHEKIGYLNDLKKQFGYDQYLIYRLALMNVALKENYYEIDDLFYDTLMKTQIFTSEDNIVDLYSKVMRGEVYSNPNSIGLYEKKLTFDVFNEGYEKPPLNIFIAEKYRDKILTNTDIYCSMIHETRHALTSQIQGKGFMDDKTYFERSGLRLDFLFKDQGYAVIGDKINEAYNETASINLMNTILKYKNNKLDNIEIKFMLNNFKKGLTNGMYESDAYIMERILLAPIFNNEDIQNIVEDVEINGNMGEIFNIFVDYGSYSNEFEKLVNSFMEEGDSEKFREDLANFSVKTKEIAKFKN